jgi:hypothetical protein
MPGTAPAPQPDAAVGAPYSPGDVVPVTPRTGDPGWLRSVLLVLAVTVTTGAGVRPVSDLSPWLHLRIGQFLLDGGRFGMPDPWAPYASRPYVLTEWLPAIAAQEVYRLTGLPGIAWLRCLGMLALLGALLWTTRQVAETVPAVIGAFAGLAGALTGLTERPQLLSFVFLAVVAGAWWRTADDLRPRWWLAPLTWLWACCHGLWPVGVGVGVVVVAGLVLDRRLGLRRAGRLLVVPAASLLLAALTPVGPRLLLTPFTVGGNVREFVGEWQPTTVASPTAVVTLGMLGIVLLCWARSRTVPPWWQIGLAAVSGVATLVMLRTVAVGAVLAAPLFAQCLQGLRGRPVVPAGRRGRLGTLALLVAAALVAAPLTAALAQAPRGVPEGLRAQLSMLPAGTLVLDDDNISGWLLWAEPHLRPVVDMRSEIYSAEHLRGYVRAMAAAPGWQGFVDRTGARYALVRDDSALAAALEDQRRWHSLGGASGYVLLQAP